MLMPSGGIPFGGLRTEPPLWAHAAPATPEQTVLASAISSPSAVDAALNGNTKTISVVSSVPVVLTPRSDKVRDDEVDSLSCRMNVMLHRYRSRMAQSQFQDPASVHLDDEAKRVLCESNDDYIRIGHDWRVLRAQLDAWRRSLKSRDSIGYGARGASLGLGETPPTTLPRSPEPPPSTGRGSLRRHGALRTTRQPSGDAGISFAYGLPDSPEEDPIAAPDDAGARKGGTRRRRSCRSNSTTAIFVAEELPAVTATSTSPSAMPPGRGVSAPVGGRAGASGSRRAPGVRRRPSRRSSLYAALDDRGGGPAAGGRARSHLLS